MNILHITPHLGGGIGTVVLNWVQKDNSNTVHTIISLDKNNNPDWIKADAGSPRVSIFDNCYNSIGFKDFLLKNIETADIVLVHWWNHPLLYEILVKFQWPPCRLIIWDHVNSLLPPYSTPLKLFEFVDYFVFTSPVSYECPEIKKLHDKSKEKITVIWSTVGVEGFENLEKIPHDTFNIGYVGTVDFGKLNRNFISLCASVNIPNARFVVTSGDSQRHLIDEAKDMGIYEKFEFLGSVPRVPCVPRILQEIDILGYPLQPQNFATCEQAIGEAMMAGCVPVVLGNPTERYIVKHLETGMVAETLDDYPRHIEWLYHHPDERKRIAENAKVWAKQRYDIQMTMREWQGLFEKAMHLDKSPRSWNKEKNGSMTAAELYAESMGEYGTPFVEYMRAGSAAGKNEYLRQIKDLFDTNPMFYSRNKGSVLQYLRFFPEDAVLREWAGRL